MADEARPSRRLPPETVLCLTNRKVTKKEGGGRREGRGGGGGDDSKTMSRKQTESMGREGKCKEGRAVSHP